MNEEYEIIAYCDAIGGMYPDPLVVGKAPTLGKAIAMLGSSRRKGIRRSSDGATFHRHENIWLNAEGVEVER